MTNANGQESRSTEDRIGETLMVCVFRWRVRDVSDARIEEMEDHLREVVDNGQSVESVIGDDLVAFAEEWANVTRSERSFVGWALESAGLSRSACLLPLSSTIYSHGRWHPT